MNNDTGAGEQLKFPRRYRLTKTDEYSSVFGFRRAIRGSSFLLHYLPGQAQQADPRIGLVIGKKQMKRAVDRNLVKRIAREIFRQLRPTLPPHDLVLRLATKVKKPDRKMLAIEIRDLFGRLKRQKIKSVGESGA